MYSFFYSVNFIGPWSTFTRYTLYALSGTGSHRFPYPFPAFVPSGPFPR